MMLLLTLTCLGLAVVCAGRVRRERRLRRRSERQRLAEQARAELAEWNLRYERRRWADAAVAEAERVLREGR